MLRPLLCLYQGLSQNTVQVKGLFTTSGGLVLRRSGSSLSRGRLLSGCFVIAVSRLLVTQTGELEHFAGGAVGLNFLMLHFAADEAANGVAYNDLYDPLMGRSVCITGQLLLLELSVHLTRECPTLKIIQLNTDGIMVSFDNSDEAKWQEISHQPGHGCPIYG